MSILQEVAMLALRPVLGGAADQVINFLADHRSDQGQRLLDALQTANDRAWKALELALAGESWWDRIAGTLARKEDQALGQQIRQFLAGIAIPELTGKTQFRQACLAELRQARAKKLLTFPSLVRDELTQEVGRLSRVAPQQLLSTQWEVLQRVARLLQQQGFRQLASVLEKPTGSGESILGLAVRYYFRREVEKDAELARGLTLVQLDQLSKQQSDGLAALHDAFAQQSDRLEGLLGELQNAVQEVHDTAKIIDGKLDRQSDQITALRQEILQALRQYQLDRRELQPKDSLSINNETERALVRQLMKRVRALPEEQRRNVPDLLNSLGKLEVAAGEFAAAQRDFQEVSKLTQDRQLQGEAYYNAYRAALEQHDWDGALEQLLKAITLDPRRYAPFAVTRYKPVKILGAGGFGVAFRCQHRHMGIDVVVKSLLLDDCQGGCEGVFREAQLLARLQHPAFVRMSDCGFVDSANQSRPYLVMEYFEGVSLDLHVKKHGCLSLADLKAVMRPVVQGLELAHSKGILHRDIKPANILVRKDESGWDVRLIDFGLALTQEAILRYQGGDGGRTLAGLSVAGTLEYAAPEQMGRLPGVAVGTHSDVYGFGKTCYFALLGTPDPDDRQKAQLPLGWRRFLSDCTAHPDHRESSFTEVLKRLNRLGVPGERKQPRQAPEEGSDTRADSPSQDTATTRPPSEEVWSLPCPHCKQPLQLRSGLRGREVRCPRCTQPFRVPDKPEAPASPSAPPAATTPPAATAPLPQRLQMSCPHCRKTLGVPAALVGKTVKCPGCSGAFTVHPKPLGTSPS